MLKDRDEWINKLVEEWDNARSENEWLTKDNEVKSAELIELKQLKFLNDQSYAQLENELVQARSSHRSETVDVKLLKQQNDVLTKGEQLLKDRIKAKESEIFDLKWNYDKQIDTLQE